MVGAWVLLVLAVRELVLLARLPYKISLRLMFYIRLFYTDLRILANTDIVF